MSEDNYKHHVAKIGSLTERSQAGIMEEKRRKKPYTKDDLETVRKILKDYGIQGTSNRTWKPPANIKTYADLMHYKRVEIEKRLESYND